MRGKKKLCLPGNGRNIGYKNVICFFKDKLFSFGMINKSTQMERSVDFCSFGRDRPVEIDGAEV